MSYIYKDGRIIKENTIKNAVLQELNSQLKDENISEKFDSLKEIAEYLSKNPTELETIKTAIEDIPTKIDSAINKLNVEDTAIEGLYVSSVSESAGKIQVTRSKFPPFKPVWSVLNERDYSKEYFTVINKSTTEVLIVLNRDYFNTNQLFTKKVTDGIWHEFPEDNSFVLLPNESVMLKGSLTMYNTLYFLGTKLYIGSIVEIMDGDLIIQGNLASLVYGDDFIGKTSWPTNINSREASIFYAFFEATIITDASNLVLPFMDYAAYQYMFRNCSYLKKAPKILPLKDEHKEYGVSYQGMFEQCSSLEESPIICAQSFVCSYGACKNMFEGCNKLKKITMLATNFFYGAEIYMDTFYNWVNGVAPEGVFIKNKDIDLSILPRGKDTIPEGWTIEDYKE